MLDLRAMRLFMADGLNGSMIAALSGHRALRGGVLPGLRGAAAAARFWGAVSWAALLSFNRSNCETDRRSEYECK
jgi:hypothetical protein